ncbi:MAG: SRPBCC domain-containing protein [Cyclobacteriaceae bacterium]
MNRDKIKIHSEIFANRNKVWDYYTNPIHIVNWNFASEDWCCPRAENDLQIGGTYKARMEAKDGSFGFDFEAIYKEINPLESFSYGFENRSIQVRFEEMGKKTKVMIEFDPESENPIEMQKNGWQSILNNFKKYVESNK